MWDHLAWIVRAFNTLNGSRQQTFGGEGPIQISEMLAYCEMAGVDGPDDRVEFLELITAMDYAFLDERRKRAEANKDKEKRKGKGS